MRVACPSGLPCNKLSYPCIVCNLSTNCTYGAVVNTTCYPEADVDCTVSMVLLTDCAILYSYKVLPYLFWESNLNVS